MNSFLFASRLFINYLFVFFSHTFSCLAVVADAFRKRAIDCSGLRLAKWEISRVRNVRNITDHETALECFENLLALLSSEWFALKSQQLNSLCKSSNTSPKVKRFDWKTIREHISSFTSHKSSSMKISFECRKILFCLIFREHRDKFVIDAHYWSAAKRSSLHLDRRVKPQYV